MDDTAYFRGKIGNRNNLGNGIRNRELYAVRSVADKYKEREAWEPRDKSEYLVVIPLFDLKMTYYSCAKQIRHLRYQGNYIVNQSKL